MEKSAILHIPQSEYAFVRSGNVLTIRLRAKAGDLTGCSLYYADRADMHTPVEFAYLPMRMVLRDALHDYYEVTFQSPYERVCYYFKLEKQMEWIYYYGDRFTRELADLDIHGQIVEGRSEYYQYPYMLRQEEQQIPEWFQNAVVYNIFPDSFANEKENLKIQSHDILTESGNRSKNRLGGTIKGILMNLDYIQDMGFNCIYLNPIFAAGEYHKYDIWDYYHVDPCLGTDEEFGCLAEEVHRRGMHLIIDGVFNHCSWHFFAFEDVVRNGENSVYKDWFYDLEIPVVRPEDEELPNYACFAYEKKMPKLNTANKEVQQYFADVSRYWIEKYHIDGWRLDVANEVSKEFWRHFRQAARAINPEIVLIGEVWENARVWLKGDMFDSVMNYKFRGLCRDFFALGKMDGETFASSMAKMYYRYPDHVSDCQLNLLDSHDVPRFLSLCGGDLKKWKLAFLVLAFYPGIPSLFYGDEKGIEGIKEFAYRSPMKWEERNETAAFVKEVMKIRKKYVKSGMKGRLYVPENQKNLLILERRDKNDVIEIQMNTGVDLCGMDLSGMDLSGMDLCGMEEKEESTVLYGEGISEESIGASGFVIIYRKETSE
ncbi:glycoside hydrolase family 13 protein [uncultured Robinsoniella sp.]|uniref:glycoside hydrolase family 13 protein n=1 Tax=Robinsoniella sp. TaxID=2496533 RepID=UPI00374FA073